MHSRHMPVRPDLNQLRREAEELLPGGTTLADAQDALARSYGVHGWPRLVQACGLVDAIWRDEVDEVRDLIEKHPHLLHENALGTDRSNWGPPMSYAANLGRNTIIKMLHELGAKDLEKAMARALLQSKIETARMLHAMAGDPELPRGAVMWSAETLSAAGFAYALELGAEICDSEGDWRAPVAMVLETYSRHPEGKHQIWRKWSRAGSYCPTLRRWPCIEEGLTCSIGT